MRFRERAVADGQKGVALLVGLLLVFLATATWMLRQSSGIAVRNQFERTTASALSQAKEALIGRAAVDDDRPGSLPCPDLIDNGVSPLLVGNNCPSYVGRLPWKTLRIGDLRDASGERLWYALAPALRNDNSAQPVNSQKPLEITLDGTPNIAAIVLSPGLALADQNGRPSNAAADYLDGSNNDGDNAYISGPATPTFNDKILAITREDLFRTVHQRVLAEVRGINTSPLGAPNWGLRHYYADNGSFPWADSGADGYGDVGTVSGNLPYRDLAASAATPTWLTVNGWLPLVTYQRLSPSQVRIGLLGSTRTLDVVP